MEKALPPPGTILPVEAPGAVEAAVRILRAGGIVGLPTETVYGLAADARNEGAVAKIYAAKGRPSVNPLIAHVAGAEAARRLVRFGAAAEALAEAFWPGPLTLVAPPADPNAVAANVRAGHDTLAVRAPVHPTARAVLEAFDGPLAAPSANRSGRISATRAAHVAEDLGDRIDLILDAGPCLAGLESTIVRALGDGPVEILRPGAVAAEDLAAVVALSEVCARTDDAAPLAPGMMTSHYAPKAALRLHAVDQRAGEAYLGLAEHEGERNPRLNLSPRGDLAEAAANLFAHLRTLDDAGMEVIAVAPVPHHGLGAAINDRLARAAAPRPQP